MPTYVYRSKGGKGCEKCADRFEVKQSISDDPLEECPECGSPVERVITGVHVRTTQSTKSLLSGKNLKKHGFTKLTREDKGVYRKE